MIIKTEISRRAVCDFFSQLNVLICMTYRWAIPIVKNRLLTGTQCGQLLKRMVNENSIRSVASKYALTET
jgi:hypothetical protein